MRILLPILLLAAAARADAAMFEVKKLADGVYAAISSEPAPPAVSNSAFVVLDDGVLVVDSHMKPEAATALLAEIKKVTEKPVRYLVQTHFHGDHVGGNPAFPGAIDIIAHEATRRTLEKWNPTKARLPDAVVNDGITFHRGREVQVRFSGRGHTAGDLYVWLPKEKVLIAGDLLFKGYIGFLKDAFVIDWAKTLSSLIALEPATVVPGHGDLAKVDDLVAFKKYLLAFRDAVRKHKERGDPLEKTLKTFELPGEYKSWGMQDMALQDNIKRAWEQLP